MRTFKVFCDFCGKFLYTKPEKRLLSQKHLLRRPRKCKTSFWTELAGNLDACSRCKLLAVHIDSTFKRKQVEKYDEVDVIKKEYLVILQKLVKS